MTGTHESTKAPSIHAWLHRHLGWRYAVPAMEDHLIQVRTPEDALVALRRYLAGRDAVVAGLRRDDPPFRKILLQGNVVTRKELESVIAELVVEYGHMSDTHGGVG